MQAKNFSGLAEQEVTSLPPEARAMVMTGTTTLMHNQQANGMMGMNQMMGDMGGMQMQMGMPGLQGMGGQFPNEMGSGIPQNNEMAESNHGMVLPQDGSSYNPTVHNVGADFTTQVSLLHSNSNPDLLF